MEQHHAPSRRHPCGARHPGWQQFPSSQLTAFSQTTQSQQRDERAMQIAFKAVIAFCCSARRHAPSPSEERAAERHPPWMRFAANRNVRLGSSGGIPVWKAATVVTTAQCIVCARLPWRCVRCYGLVAVHLSDMDGAHRSRCADGSPAWQKLRLRSTPANPSPLTTPAVAGGAVVSRE